MPCNNFDMLLQISIRVKLSMSSYVLVRRPFNRANLQEQPMSYRLIDSSLRIDPFRATWCKNSQWPNALHFPCTGLVRRPRSKATWCRSVSWQRPPLPDVTLSIPDMDSSPRMWSLRSCASSAALYSWDPPPPPLGEEVNIKYF
jgi:hypothetical protein